ncbi:MAG: hypothetical protein QOI54_152 [Actinomycetota bacterium]|jgi:hypothetical protein|nr:hypothetical protein [Actinomycetota bacterium]
MADLTPWAEARIRQACQYGDLPRYGSRQWEALQPGDQRRWAAVIVAAEAWRDHCSPERVAGDLRQQMADEDAALYRRVREASWDVAGARDWAALAKSPTHAELVARRSS